MQTSVRLADGASLLIQPPQLINLWQPAENSLAQCTKLIKPDYSTNSKFLSSHP
jgi:hypothetical protein